MIHIRYFNEIWYNKNCMTFTPLEIQYMIRITQEEDRFLSKPMRHFSSMNSITHMLNLDQTEVLCHYVIQTTVANIDEPNLELL